MAGRSPDRSEQQQSSGETTEEPAAVPDRPEASSDPRLAWPGADGELSPDAEPSPDGELSPDAEPSPDAEREPAGGAANPVPAGEAGGSSPGGAVSEPQARSGDAVPATPEAPGTDAPETSAPQAVAEAGNGGGGQADREAGASTAEADTAADRAHTDEPDSGAPGAGAAEGTDPVEPDAQDAPDAGDSGGSTDTADSRGSTDTKGSKDSKGSTDTTDSAGTGGSGESGGPAADSDHVPDQATAVFRVGPPATRSGRSEDRAEADQAEETGGNRPADTQDGPGERPEEPAEAQQPGEPEQAPEGQGPTGEKDHSQGDPEGTEDVGSRTTALRIPSEGTLTLRPPKQRPSAEPSTSGADGSADQPAEQEAEQEAGKAPAGQISPDSRFVPLRTDAAGAAPATPPPAAPPPAPASAPPSASADPGRPAAPPESESRQRETVPPEAEKDPLALLAQLTNKPAPPPTPLRTVLRRIKIWTPMVILLAVIFATAQLLRPLPEPSLHLTAASEYGFEGEAPSMPWPTQGQAALEVEGLGSLGAYGEQKPVPIASVAKVMTAYLVLRNHPVKEGTEGEVLTVDQQAAADVEKGADGESVVDVVEGQQMSQKEALQALLIASANNVARMLARWDAQSEEAFVERMNATAKELGMENTTYTDPSGLRAETVSTALDQVKLAKKAMADPLFREIVRQPSYVDSQGVKHDNWNRLVPLNGVVGIKTGTTTKAGGNLVFAAEKEIGGTRQLIIGAVLGQQSSTSILDEVLARSKDLILAAQDALQDATVVRKGEVVGEVDDGLGGTTELVATEDVTAVGWSGLKVDLDLVEGEDGVPHQAEAGERPGTLTVGSGPGQVRVPVALKEDLVEPGFWDKLGRLL